MSVLGSSNAEFLGIAAVGSGFLNTDFFGVAAWKAALAAAIPAGVAAAVVKARYAGRVRPFPVEIILLILAMDLVALWALDADPFPPLWASCLFGWFLVALAAIDLEVRRLPDPLTFPLIALGLAVAWIFDPSSTLWHALAAALGGLVFYAIGEFYFRYRGQDGLGLGDAKLMAALGAWVGLAALPGVVFLGAATAILALLGESLLRRRPLSRVSAISFGPFLAFAAWVSWLYGPLLPTL